jgi:predicted Fe-Mo cluster-binding NifX family protein
MHICNSPSRSISAMQYHLLVAWRAALSYPYFTERLAPVLPVSHQLAWFLHYRLSEGTCQEHDTWLRTCGDRPMGANTKIAIPTFAERVSPRFDCAQTILVVTIDQEGTQSQREQLEASDWAPHERINKLLELDVDTVVCGGIDRWSVESLRSAGVTIYGWVAGEVENALAALLRGDLDSEAASRSGDRCQCRRLPGDDGAGPRFGAEGRAGKGRGGQGRKRAGGRRGGRGGARAGNN